MSSMFIVPPNVPPTNAKVFSSDLQSLAAKFGPKHPPRKVVEIVSVDTNGWDRELSTTVVWKDQNTSMVGAKAKDNPKGKKQKRGNSNR
jgi:hypothetical protein